VNETRQNHNEFPTPYIAANYVIENFNYTIIPNSSFQTIYFFANANFTGELLPGANPSLMAYIASLDDEENSTYSEEL